MVTTDFLNNGSQATLTPISYQVKQTLVNGENCFTDWLFKDKNTASLAFSYTPAIGILGFKVKGENESGIESRFVSTTNESVLEKIEARIFNRLSFPSHWAGEGIMPPNMASKVKAFEICRYLFQKHTLIPDRIASTKEEGVFLAFDTNTGERTLLIEIYNNLETGLLINDNVGKKILLSEDITGLDFAKAVNILNG
ncbi:MAG: hypothetical protein PHC61_00585 [Chitinivibrionales bacterium]|nr:hypothetical protein [Chitinivibrionales bacterium]